MLCSYSFASFVFINKYPVVENRKKSANRCSIRHLKVSGVLKIHQLKGLWMGREKQLSLHLNFRRLISYRKTKAVTVFDTLQSK